MNIKLAYSDEEIAACYPVMQQLRPHIGAEEFVQRVRSQQDDGYRLAYIEANNSLAAVAGFRIGQNLAWGRFLYVDDLVTYDEKRSSGYGRQLLSWLKAFAIEKGCEQLHLDSGVQRTDAHRFYEREGMQRASYHFVQALK